MRRSRLYLSTLMAVAALAHVRGEPMVRDVGDGLHYARVTRAPDDLPATEHLAGRAAVVDLRYATDDGTADAPLTAMVRAMAGAKRPVFLLVNAETSPRLLRTVGALDALPGVITIARVGSAVTADFAAVITPEEERRAYEAFVAGKSVVELTTDLPGKRRNDEASLSQHPPAADSRPDESGDDGTPPPETATARSPKPLVDVALQRAVHLYRGLRALKTL